MFAIAIHGGAGTIAKEGLDSEKTNNYKTALQEAVDAGFQVLERGGTAMDAVTAAVVALENCPLFNAGKGSVFNHEGGHEMDASVMNGSDCNAGAVAGIQGVKNPVLLARAVMEQSDHVFLSGPGAVSFARERQLELAPDDYFFDALRYEQYKEARAQGRVQLDHTVSGDHKFSTVGAVALDMQGHLAAATSTGGMTNKRFGRVGDTPVIGAGTYAHDQTCAISCTGHGEFFLRQVTAHQVHCLMAYKELSLADACRQVVMEELVQLGGEGGLVAIDHKGNVCMPYNSEGMYRGYRKSDGSGFVAIHNS